MADPSAIVPPDLRNAYGLFLRSHALRAAVEFNSDIATLAAAEWSQKPEFWIEVQGKWVCQQTHRGFWQSRRLAMLMFCLSLAKVLVDPTLGLAAANLACASIQDDTYLVGPHQRLCGQALGVGRRPRPQRTRITTSKAQGLGSGLGRQSNQRSARLGPAALYFGGTSRGRHPGTWRSFARAPRVSPWPVVGSRSKGAGEARQGVLGGARAADLHEGSFFPSLPAPRLDSLVAVNCPSFDIRLQTGAARRSAPLCRTT